MIRDYEFGINVEHSYPHVKITIEAIYPDIASKMLEANINNRDKKREPLADAIRNDEWVLNGATIVFSDEGELLDGQNRLYACVESGKPIVTIVVRGVKKDAQISMDTGVKRQVIDYLKMNGVKDYTIMAAVGTAMMNANTYGLQAAFYKRANRTTLKTVVDYIMTNLDHIRFIKQKTNLPRKVFSGVSSGTLGVLFDCFYKVDEEDADYFIEQLNSPCPQSQPIAMLRDALLKNASKKEGQMSQKYIGAIIIKTWNAYMAGAEIRQLKFAQGGANPESFPKIYGLDESYE